MDQMFQQAFSLINGLPEPWGSIVKLVACVIVVGYLLYKTVVFIPQDREGIKLRFGKVVYGNGSPVILKPGLHVIVPFTHSIEQVSTLEKVIRLKTTTHSSFYVSYKDERAGGVRFPASITVMPVNVHAWRYVNEDAESRVTDIGITALQGAITSASPEVILENSIGFSNHLFDTYRVVIDKELEKYGVRLTAVNIGMADIPDTQPLADAFGQKRAST